MNLVVQLRNIKDLTPSEREVANFIMQDPASIISMKITDCAQKSFTSPSTVMRLVKKLGLESFTTFKVTLARDLKSFLDTEFVYSKALPFEQESSAAKIIDNISKINAQAIINSISMNSIESYEAICDVLEDAKLIDFYGIGESNTIAKDALTKAMRLGIHAVAHSDQGLQLTSSTQANHQRVAFLISYTGETSIMVRIARNLASEGVSTISLTSSAENTMAGLCDYNLIVEASDSVFNLGHMSSRMAMLNVLDCLFTIYANRNYHENLEILKRTYNYQTEVE